MAAEISILSNTKFHVYKLTIYLHVHTEWFYTFGSMLAFQRPICIQMFLHSMCVCVFNDDGVWQKMCMHLQEHVNTFVQITFWPLTHNSYDTLIRIMQQYATNFLRILSMCDFNVFINNFKRYVSCSAYRMGLYRAKGLPTITDTHECSNGIRVHVPAEDNMSLRHRYHCNWPWPLSSAARYWAERSTV
jgi:hypothetical protein